MADIFKDNEKINRNDFQNEKEFCDYIELNIAVFCKDLLDGELESYKREWFLNDLFPKFGTNKPRIDFMIKLKDGRRVGVECKNPKNLFSELARTLSQLLAYSVIAEENKAPLDELILVTSGYDDYLIKVVKKFNLPVRVFLLNRLYHSEVKYKKDE